MSNFLTSPYTHKAKKQSDTGDLGGDGYVYYLDCGHAPITGCMFMSELCAIISIYINIQYTLTSNCMH